MKREDILKGLKELREKSKKRNFLQSVDLVIVLKGLDLKRPENRIEEYVTLPHGIGKELKVCAFVGKEMETKAKEVCDKVVREDELEGFKDKKEMKKFVRSYDIFISQANIMPKVAAKLGKYLSVLGKLPNPKSGAIFPSNVDLKPLITKLKKTVKLFQLYFQNQNLRLSQHMYLEVYF